MNAEIDQAVARQKTADRIQGISPWFHSIDLGNGVVTPGQAPIHIFRDAADVYFSIDIAGKSVLDVGAWDGFFSFEAERRGASRVVAADWFCWNGPGPGNPEAFKAAKEILGSRVEQVEIDIPDMTVDRLGQFDVVLFNGIFYHILDPIHALLAMSKIAKEVLIVETYVDNMDYGRAVMNFFPYDRLKPGFPQTGWGPNHLLMHSLLRHIGFETVVQFPTPHMGDTRQIFIAFKSGSRHKEFLIKHAAKTNPWQVVPASPKLSWLDIGYEIARKFRSED